ncbi:MAG: hypothetical protein AAGK04_03390, partial [Planctomycetota bacterium]
MSDDPRRHHSPLEELEEAIVEIERRVIRLGRMRIPLPKKRYLALGAVGLLLAIAGGLYVLTQTGVTKALVLPRVSGLIAAPVEAERVRFQPDGTLVIDAALVRAPGVEGEAGAFLAIDRLDAKLRWGALLTGRVVVDRLTLVRPEVTLSQHRETGRLNVGGLALASGKESVGAPVLPEIAIEGGAIVLGEHDDETFTTLRRLEVDDDTSGLKRVGEKYEFALKEVDADNVDPIRLAGTLDDTGIDLTLNAVALERWSGGAMPERLESVWERLDVEGAIAGATMRYDAAEGSLDVVVGLDGVALTLPTGGREAPGPRMRDVSGELRFQNEGFQGRIVGNLLETPFEVDLDYHGFDPESPFQAKLTTEDWWLEGQPEILDYAPHVVRRRLGTFGFPSAMVNAEVNLWRGDPVAGVPAKIDYEASILFERGTAAYEYFPYVFENMSGEILVTSDALNILRIEGEASTGARIGAEGVIAPPKPGAEVDLTVVADGVPVDEALVQALGAHRRKLVKALFNEDEYADLLEAGLVIPPAEARALERERATLERTAQTVGQRERLAEIEHRLQTPAFEPGGQARVEVRILRALGDDSEFERRITIRLDEAGILPEQFPLPIRAEGLVIEIVGDDLRLAEGEYSTLRGGEATVSAVADLGLDADGKPKPFAPRIDVQARGVPIDDLLVHAIPGPSDRQTAEAGTSVRQILNDLRLVGDVDCTALIAPRAEGDKDLGFDVHVRANSVSASPEARFASDRIAINGVSGSLRVSERRLDLSLAGEAWPAGELPHMTQGVRSLGRVELSADVTFARSDAGLREPVFTADVQATDVDLTGPYEDLVAVFSPEGAQTLADLRAARRPAGGVKLQSRLRSRSDGGVDVGVTLSRMRDVSFDAAGGRLTLGDTEGAMHVRIGEETHARFDTLVAPIEFDGAPAGMMTLSGTTPIGASGGREAGDRPRDALDVTLSDGRFESGLVGAIASQRMGEGFASLFASIEPQGGFDLELTAEPMAGGAAGEPAPLRLGGLLRPRSLALTLDGERVRFDRVEGLVQFDRSEGSFTNLRGWADGWSFYADGAWATRSAGGLTVDADLEVESSGLPASLRAVLPRAMGQTFDDLALTSDGSLRVDGTTLRLDRANDAAPWTFETRGEAS